MREVHVKQGERSCQKVGKWKLGGNLFVYQHAIDERPSTIDDGHQLRMFHSTECLFSD